MKDAYASGSLGDTPDMLLAWEEAGKFTDEYQAKLAEIVAQQTEDAQWAAKASSIIDKIGTASGAAAAGYAGKKADLQ